MRHLKQIFDKLNLTKEKGLYLAHEDRSQLFSNRVERLLNNVIKPDAFFCIDNKPFILFFENLGDFKKKKLKEIWNFNETPIVIVSEQDSVEIYNGFEYLANKETLKLFGNEDKLNDFKYFEIVTGKTWEKYQSSFNSEHRVDSYLLKNIKSARDILISQSLSSEHANSLIGKIIFVRYIIDRKIKLNFEKKGTSRIWTNPEFCKILSDKNQVQKFFKYLKDKFNGDLFPLSKTDIQSIPSECLTTLIELLSGDNVGTGQKSLFNLYDFSIIPVEFISNVYELFIGVDEQEKQGAYYTPLFLVDYILAETVEKKFSNYKGYDCKVLDPACGSGIFLVETLRKIIEKYQAKNPNYKTNIDQYKEDLKKLASDNIYGVDKDKSAINVAVFSIYLTLLDYQNPSDIENFKFPHLENQNFFVSDFFDTESEFNKVLRKKEFSFILGNPPWKGNSIGKLGKEYLSNRLKNEKKLNKEHSISINNGELAEGFLLRVSDFSKTHTEVALIIRSQILYNTGYEKSTSSFRKYFLQEFYLDKVFELAPARREIFTNAIAPASILFYRYAFNESTYENETTHISLKPSRFFSLFKIFTLQRNDVQKISQSKLIQYDWLFKCLVYGSYLDFNFIKRLKNNYKSISERLKQDESLLSGTGIQFSSSEKENSEDLIGLRFIDTYGVSSFYIDENKVTKFQKKKVHRKRDIRLFKPPMLLIREGVDMGIFRAKCAISKTSLLFKDSIAVIKSNDNDLATLRNIGATLQSKLFSYYAVITFSSIGIERERVKNYNKFSLPFLQSKKLPKIVNDIEHLNSQEYDSERILKKIGYPEKLQNLFKNIDEEVFRTINISDLELALLDYAINISIPQIKQQKDYYKISESLAIDSNILMSYIDLFLNSFNEIYKRIDQKLVVEIKYTKQLIGLFFKLTPINSDINNKSKSIQENTTILEQLSVLGVEKITDKLFIQKDVRGFENNGFYIVKPNEKRLWHKAIAHLDVNEFRDAILIAGKHTTINV